MALPKAAQKQLADAEKLHAEVYKEDEAPKLEEVRNESPAEDSTDEQLSGKAETTVSEVSGAPEEIKGDAPQATAEESVDWQQKYKVLQGKYNAEVPRLQQDNNALQGRMSEMESMLQSLQQQALEQPMSEPLEATESLLKPDEIQDYGEDMIDVVKRAAREEMAPMLSQLQKENEGLRGLLGGVQQQSAMSARDAMLASLDNELSHWREINSHPEFISWLENVDPYSGHKKLDMLRQAFEGNNTSRVLAFFKGYQNENAAFTPNSAPNQSADPQVSLDTLVAPGRPSEGTDTRAQDGNASGNAWTQNQIQEFYRDVNRGVYRNKPEEKDRIEADIFLAQSNGLIT